ncbi:hypothetical protein L210DRAFT_3760822 [Boletus edulis BED1]|uniref:Uncharacterized protein n=1 Tax=Boletus edulis BED1 TaxID=1328754 RepID=A0AAD4BUA5_BOLED|nr:hypothetical protein L210DRAFT_3760822 [Boletus edulis BED1]
MTSDFNAFESLTMQSLVVPSLGYFDVFRLASDEMEREKFGEFFSNKVLSNLSPEGYVFNLLPPEVRPRQFLITSCLKRHPHEVHVSQLSSIVRNLGYFARVSARVSSPHLFETTSCLMSLPNNHRLSAGPGTGVASMPEGLALCT